MIDVNSQDIVLMGMDSQNIFLMTPHSEFSSLCNDISSLVGAEGDVGDGRNLRSGIGIVGPQRRKLVARMEREGHRGRWGGLGPLGI